MGIEPLLVKAAAGGNRRGFAGGWPRAATLKLYSHIGIAHRRNVLGMDGGIDKERSGRPKSGFARRSVCRGLVQDHGEVWEVTARAQPHNSLICLGHVTSAGSPPSPFFLLLLLRIVHGVCRAHAKGSR